MQSTLLVLCILFELGAFRKSRLNSMARLVVTPQTSPKCNEECL